MKKLQHIIMIALILLGLVTPALAQEQTDNFNVSAKHAIAIEATTGKSSMKRTPLLLMVWLQ